MHITFLTEHTHGPRTYGPGDTLAVGEPDARWLIAHGVAREAGAVRARVDTVVTLIDPDTPDTPDAGVRA